MVQIGEASSAESPVHLWEWCIWPPKRRVYLHAKWWSQQNPDSHACQSSKRTQSGLQKIPTSPNLRLEHFEGPKSREWDADLCNFLLFFMYNFNTDLLQQLWLVIALKWSIMMGNRWLTARCTTQWPWNYKWTYSVEHYIYFWIIWPDNYALPTINFHP